MRHNHQYQKTTTTKKKRMVLLQLRRSCGCLYVCVGVHESNRTRGQPLHKHHILHKHCWGTWLNAAMEAQREKGRAGEKVSSPAVAPSKQIPFKGTETPDNLPCEKTNMLHQLWVRAVQGPLRWRRQKLHTAALLSEHSLLQMHHYAKLFLVQSEVTALAMTSCELCCFNTTAWQPLEVSAKLMVVI